MRVKIKLDASNGEGVYQQDIGELFFGPEDIPSVNEDVDFPLLEGNYLVKRKTKHFSTDIENCTYCTYITLLLKKRKKRK